MGNALQQYHQQQQEAILLAPDTLMQGPTATETLDMATHGLSTTLLAVVQYGANGFQSMSSTTSANSMQLQLPACTPMMTPKQMADQAIMNAVAMIFYTATIIGCYWMWKLSVSLTAVTLTVGSWTIAKVWWMSGKVWYLASEIARIFALLQKLREVMLFSVFSTAVAVAYLNMHPEPRNIGMHALNGLRYAMGMLRTLYYTVPNSQQMEPVSGAV